MAWRAVSISLSVAVNTLDACSLCGGSRRNARLMADSARVSAFRAAAFCRLCKRTMASATLSPAVSTSASRAGSGVVVMATGSALTFAGVYRLVSIVTVSSTRLDEHDERAAVANNAQRAADFSGRVQTSNAAAALFPSSDCQHDDKTFGAPQRLEQRKKLTGMDRIDRMKKQMIKAKCKAQN